MPAVFQEEQLLWHSNDCILQKLVDKLQGLTTQTIPESNAKNANSFVLRVEALLCGFVWVDRQGGGYSLYSDVRDD